MLVLHLHLMIMYICKMRILKAVGIKFFSQINHTFEIIQQERTDNRDCCKDYQPLRIAFPAQLRHQRCRHIYPEVGDEDIGENA